MRSCRAWSRAPSGTTSATTAKDPLYFEHNMGIVYRDFRPKPAYVALATLATVLQRKKLDQAVPGTDGTLAYRFVATQPGGEKAIVLWNPSRTATESVEVDATKVVLVNAIGERCEQETAAGAAQGSRGRSRSG